MEAKNRIFNTLLVIFLLLQIVFWYNTNDIRPEMTIVPPVPGKEAVNALSFGDEQFYFRSLALEIQNAGDSFGRFTALKNYNYKKLTAWFEILDGLDHQSNFIPSIAGYYYSQTQNVPDVRYIINYLDKHASRDLKNKWWWMSQAVYLANHRLGDKPLALKLAYKLSKTPGKVPMWVREMPAFIHEQLGEKEEALRIIEGLMKDQDKLTKEELNFMNYFITERLEKMQDEIKHSVVRKKH
jgi:hypothetical protein